MLTILRYWLTPGRLRRLPRPGWAVIALIYAGLLVYSPRFVNKGYGNQLEPAFWATFAPWIQWWISACVAVFGLVAGALSISRERQRETWAALGQTRLKAQEILAGKLAVILIQGGILFLPAVVLLCRAHLFGNQYPFIGGDDTDSYWNAVRMLPWAVLVMALRLLTFSLAGVAISLCCRRVQTSLAIAGGLIAGYAGVFVLAGVIAWCTYNPDDDHLHAHLFYWPVAPMEFACPDHWLWRVIADVVWGVAVPFACWIFIRLSFRATVRG